MLNVPAGKSSPKLFDFFPLLALRHSCIAKHIVRLKNCSISQIQIKTPSTWKWKDFHGGGWYTIYVGFNIPYQQCLWRYHRHRHYNYHLHRCCQAYCIIRSVPLCLRYRRNWERCCEVKTYTYTDPLCSSRVPQVMVSMRLNWIIRKVEKHLGEFIIPRQKVRSWWQRDYT